MRENRKKPKSDLDEIQVDVPDLSDFVNPISGPMERAKSDPRVQELTKKNIEVSRELREEFSEVVAVLDRLAVVVTRATIRMATDLMELPLDALDGMKQVQATLDEIDKAITATTGNIQSVVLPFDLPISNSQSVVLPLDLPTSNSRATAGRMRERRGRSRGSTTGRSLGTGDSSSFFGGSGDDGFPDGGVSGGSGGFASAGRAVDEIDEALERARVAAGGLNTEMALLGASGEALSARLVGGGGEDGGGGLAALAEVFDMGSRGAGEFGEVLDGLEGIGRRVFDGLGGALKTFVETGKFEWRDFASTAIDALGQIFQTQTGALGGGGGILDMLFGLGSSFFGGFGGGGPTPLMLSGPFAHGGRPPPGMAALVGEQGPELFVPDVPGTIVPNDMLGGPGGAGVVVNNNYTIDARGASPGMEQRIMQALKVTEQNAVNRAKMDIIRDAQRGGIFSRLPRR